MDEEFLNLLQEVRSDISVIKKDLHEIKSKKIKLKLPYTEKQLLKGMLPYTAHADEFFGEK